MNGFDKYDEGAYHWEATHSAWLRGYSPILEARYVLPLRNILSRYNAGTVRGLDVGCGDGAFLHYLAKAQIQCLGVDASLLGIKAYRELAGDEALPCIRGDAGQLPVGNGFNFVTLIDVIEHLRGPGRVLEEIHRVLEPQGSCFVTTPIAREEKLSTYHVHEFSSAELAAILSDVFDDVTIYGYAPMETYERYHTNFTSRQLIRLRSILGKNPFTHHEEDPDDSDYRFLLAVAERQ